MIEVIANITRYLLKGSAVHADINKLASYLLSLAKKHSFVNFKQNNGIDTEEIAVNAVASLFERDSNSNYYLVNTLLNWQNLDSDEDIIYALNKTIWKACEQAFHNIVKEESPVFAKIHNNLTTCIYNEKYIKIKVFERTYISKSMLEPATVKLISDEEFLKLPLKLFVPKQKMLFEGLFGHLKDELDVAPAVPLNLLAHKLEELYTGEYASEKVYQENQWDIRTQIKEAQSIIMKIIKEEYIAKNKLSEMEGEAILKGFAEMSEDLTYGITGRVNADYFRTYLNMISEKDYYSSYHGIVKFILKKYRNYIADKLVL